MNFSQVYKDLCIKLSNPDRIETPNGVIKKILANYELKYNINDIYKVKFVEKGLYDSNSDGILEIIDYNTTNYTKLTDITKPLTPSYLNNWQKLQVESDTNFEQLIYDGILMYQEDENNIGKYIPYEIPILEDVTNKWIWRDINATEKLYIQNLNNNQDIKNIAFILWNFIGLQSLDLPNKFNLNSTLQIGYELLRKNNGFNFIQTCSELLNLQGKYRYVVKMDNANVIIDFYITNSSLPKLNLNVYFQELKFNDINVVSFLFNVLLKQIYNNILTAYEGIQLGEINLKSNILSCETTSDNIKFLNLLYFGVFDIEDELVENEKVIDKNTVFLNFDCLRDLYIRFRNADITNLDEIDYYYKTLLNIN